MDFGEILEQWDAQQKEQKIKKKTHAAGAEKMSEKQVRQPAFPTL